MEKTRIIEKSLSEIFSYLGVKPQIDVMVKDDGFVEIKIKGDNLNFLIGYKGQSLDALRDILKQIVFKQTSEWPTLLIDINGYTDQRIERLQNLAKRFIDRVRFFQTEVEMPMLNPWERKQIHTLISEYDDVASESRGEGRSRKLYLLPKKHTK